MNEQLRQAMADAAGVDVDSPSTTIGDALLLPEATRNEPAPGYRITSTRDNSATLHALWAGSAPVCSSFDLDFLVGQSWHAFRQVDKRKWVLA